MATPVSAKVKIRIYGATSQTQHKDGTVSCDILVHPDDLAALKASGLLDWHSGQTADKAPSKYLTKEGAVSSIWSGVHYALASDKADVVEPKEEMLEKLSEDLKP